MKQFGLSSKERIKSEKEFELVYSLGENLFSSSHKFKALFYIREKGEQAVLKAAFAVSRKAGNAVWRNRIKRLMRESFRLNKQSLKSVVEEKTASLLIIFSPNTLDQSNSSKILLKDVQPQIVDLMDQIKKKL